MKNKGFQSRPDGPRTSFGLSVAPPSRRVSKKKARKESEILREEMLLMEQRLEVLRKSAKSTREEYEQRRYFVIGYHSFVEEMVG